MIRGPARYTPLPPPTVFRWIFRGARARGRGSSRAARGACPKKVFWGAFLGKTKENTKKNRRAQRAEKIFDYVYLRGENLPGGGGVKPGGLDINSPPPFSFVIT